MGQGGPGKGSPPAGEGGGEEEVRDVAVKVQYPGLRGAVAADLATVSA